MRKDSLIRRFGKLCYGRGWRRSVGQLFGVPLWRVKLWDARPYTFSNLSNTDRILRVLVVAARSAVEARRLRKAQRFIKLHNEVVDRKEEFLHRAEEASRYIGSCRVA